MTRAQRLAPTTAYHGDTTMTTTTYLIQYADGTTEEPADARQAALVIRTSLATARDDSELVVAASDAAVRAALDSIDESERDGSHTDQPYEEQRAAVRRLQA